MSYPILGILEFALVFQGTMAWTASVLNPFLWSLFFPSGSLIAYIAEQTMKNGSQK